ncbi:MAG: autotransporter-associated beta strand repeat-containing protein [Akkermansiaceae bacterium]|nr:autotransporter-associated beta strand repeat-containing protein [Akkermansiaceae bacterium]MCP5546923.1 autotransporter-associated beta strand repeat-containing protein [Akkermansiaceae bacterium]
MLRLLSSCRWLLPILLLFGSLALLPSSRDSEGLPTAPPAERKGAVMSLGTVDVEPLDAFEEWLADGQCPGKISRGVELARARRVVMKQLIGTDPRAALARAIPYSVRKQLPGPVAALVEEPVSTTADLEVEQACGGADGKPERRRWLMLDGRRLRVFTYGERAEVMTKRKLSVHGIAIDEAMAMLDEPLRELSTEEVADIGLSGRVAQLGKRLFAVESDKALHEARQQLRATEEMLGPTALPAYRELAHGGMDGMFPVAMQNGGADPDEDLPPVAFSQWTEGAKTMLHIRARFADEAPDYVPVTLATAQANQGEAEDFWHENSYGKSSLTTTYADVVTLPKNGSQYVGNFFTLLVDARQAAVAANPAWNHNNFDFYTVITNTVAGGFGYTGVAQLGGPGSHILRNFISVRTASHEYGHNLGLNHSEYWLSDSTSPIGADSNPGGYAGDASDDERIEYGHKFAIMGSQDFSGDFDGGRAHYSASDKNRLDWLETAAGEVVRTTTSGTFRLYRHDVMAADFGSMTPGVARAIQIDLPASDPTGFAQPYRYWLNYRMLPTDGIAENWLRNGLQVDWRRDGSGFRSVLLDMTPFSRDSGPYGAGPAYAFDNDDKEDSALLLGRTFSDTGADIHFTPFAKGGANPNEWLDVVVNIGTQGGNTAPVLSNFNVTNSNPAVGEVVNFSATASDSNGDTLAYHWDMGDNSVQAPQLNSPTRGKMWSSAGTYMVRVEVSDMKGGKAVSSRVIRVGSPADNGMIHGRVTHAGRPVEGVLIRGGGANVWTDSDGSYVLAGLPIGNATVSATKAGLTFTPQFTNPVQATDVGAFGIDFAANEPWTGGGGNAAAVLPFRIDVPLGFATQFTAQAFDNSGNPIAIQPIWAVSGGGVMDANGVFTAQNAGGPFTVTAQDGSLAATATVYVVDTGGPPPASGTWSNPGGGSWATGGNWSGNSIAAGAGNTADFSTVDITANTTVTLDAARSIGTLVFGDTNPASAATWFLNNGANGSLMLAGTNPTITVNPLGTGSFANIGARLSGYHGFTKNGTGNLILNNAANTLSGPVVINAGNLQLNSASLSHASSVAIHAGALVVATTGANAIGGTISFGGGTLQFNQVPGTDPSPQFSTEANQPYRISVTSGKDVVFGSSLASTGGSLTKLNSGTLTLAAANTYSGGTILSAGILNFANPSALGSGLVSFIGNSTLQAGVATNLGNAASVASGVTGTLDTNTNETTLSGWITGDGNLAKTGAGTLNISGGAADNTLSGAINVLAGTLAIDNVNPSPGIQSFANMNGTITVASGATFDFSQSFTAENLDNDITLNGSGSGGMGALNLWRNATATGTITLAGDATISHTYNRGIIHGTITGVDRNLTLTTLNAGQPGMEINGPIQLGTGGITVNGVANLYNGEDYSVRLSGNNSYSGETRVVTGKLMLTGNARLHDSSTVRIETGAVLQLNFAGTDTVATLFLGSDEMPEGTYGSLASTAENKSAAFEGDGILWVGDGPPGSYATWASENGIPGQPFDEDFNHDGISNGVAYALGLSPTGSSQPAGVLTGNTLTFTKGADAIANQDVSWTIETSATLEAGSWTNEVSQAAGDPAAIISHTFTPGNPVRKFARLKVENTP